MSWKVTGYKGNEVHVTFGQYIADMQEMVKMLVNLSFEKILVEKEEDVGSE